MFKKIFIILAAAAALLALASCKVSKEDVDKWGASDSEGGRLMKLTLDNNAELSLRGYALATTIKSKKIATLDEIIKTIDGKELVALITEASPEIKKALFEGDLRDQAAIKDSLYVMLERKNDQSLKNVLKDMIIGWYEIDFPKKMNAGRYAWNTVVAIFGKDGGKFIGKLFGALMTQSQTPKYLKDVVKLIKIVDDKEVYAKADDAFSKRLEKEYPNISKDSAELAYDIKGPATIAVLVRYVTDEKIDAQIRLVILQALADVKEPNAILRAAAMKFFMDEKEFRELRVVSLAALKYQAQKEDLDKILKKANDTMFKGGALEVMALRGGAPWVEKYFVVVPTIKDIVQSDYADISNILSSVPETKPMADTLAKMLKSGKTPPWQKAVAILSLKKLGEKSAIPALSEVKDKTKPQSLDFTLAELAESAVKELQAKGK